MQNNVLYRQPNKNIQIVDFVPNVTEGFVASHGMTLQHTCKCPKHKFANGPRAIGAVEDGYPKRLLGGADSLGIHYKDPHPVMSQKQVRIVDYSRVPKYNYPIPEVRL
jgi:hypothetical protein